MKSMQFKRHLLVLLVLMLVLSLCVPAFATETQTDALLTLTARTKVTDDVNQVVAKINTASSDTISDGKLTVAYDRDALSFNGIASGAAWGANTISVQVNTQPEDALVIAFAADTAAKAGNVFILTFDVRKTGFTDIAVVGDESYVTGSGKSLDAEITVEAGGHDWSDWTILQEADCFTDGSKQRVCHTCGKVDVRAIPANSENCPSAKFTDLNCDSWYHSSVDFVLKKGLMVGIGETTFSPYGTVTRDQMVTILYRLAGEPECDVVCPFEDVNPDAYYADAVAWAYSNGITMGTSARTFSPHDTLTREQMVAYLYRYAQFVGCDVTVSGDLSGYTDADQVGGYARNAMIWACENGIIKGTSAGTLSPKDGSRRVQVAAVFMRLVTLVLD